MGEMEIRKEMKGVLSRLPHFSSLSQPQEEEELSPNWPSVSGGDGLCL